MPKQPAHRARHRPPYFRAVPLRPRADGWSEWRQCHFLAQLYFTGSVSAAAQAAGMSRHSAYRLRECFGAESFAAAWDWILVQPGSARRKRPKQDWRKVTLDTLLYHVETDLIQPVIYRRRMITIRRKCDNSALLHLLNRSRSTESGRSGYTAI